MLYTTQHIAVLIIFLIFQTSTRSQMLSIDGEGKDSHKMGIVQKPCLFMWSVVVAMCAVANGGFVVR